MLLLLGLGLIMVLSASSPSALAETGDDSYVYFRKQGMFALGGLIAMMVISKIDYRKYKKFWKYAYWGSAILLIMVVIPGIGKSVNGAKRWLGFGESFRFQPSEIMKIVLVLATATYISLNTKKLNSFKGYIIPLLMLTLVVVVMFLQKHMR